MSDLYDKITSNAFNFGNNYQTGVDERTGSFNVSLKLGHLYSAGALRASLMISYNPLSTKNEGFGKGWMLNLSRYDRTNKRVKLSDGSFFNVISTSGGKLQLRYCKESDIRTEFKQNKLRIIYKDGTQEIFNTEGYLEKTISPSGHYHSYTFRSGRLERITDTEGKFIRIQYENSGFRVFDMNNTLLSYGRFQSGQLYRFEFGINHYVIVKYCTISNLSFVEQIENQTGKIEKLYYDARGLQLPSNAPTSFLPCVSRYEIKARGMVKSNEYSFKGNNYLGSTTGRFSLGYDALYELKNSYTYKATITDGYIIKEQTYNKYHLLIDEKITDAKTRQLLSHKINEYYADDKKDFNNQVNQFLQLKTERNRHYNKSGRFREIAKITHYDQYLNLVYEKDEYGIETYSSYYSKAELNAKNAHFIPHLIKSSETHPSQKYTNGKEKIKTSLFTYRAFATLDGSGEFFLVNNEKSKTGTNLDFELDFEYHQNKNNLIAFGLESGRYSQNTALARQYTDYLDHGNNVEVIKTNHYIDGLQKKTSSSYDVLSELKVAELDHLNNQTLYFYDALGRQTQEIFKPNTPYEFTTDYHYAIDDLTLNIVKNGQSFQRIIYDELGRKTQTFKVDSKGLLKQDQSFTYDQYDRVTRTTTFDQHDNQILQHTITTEYSDWWTKREYDENNTSNLTTIDPATMTETVCLIADGQEFSRRITQKNELDSELMVQIGNQATYSYYDGYNQKIKQQDARGLVTEFELDALGREIKRYIKGERTIEVRLDYDPLHLDDAVTDIFVNGTLIGQRSFDGMGRISREKKAGNTIHYSFSTPSDCPTRIQTSNGLTVYQNIDPHLEVILSEYTSNADRGYITYDKKNKLIIRDEKNGNIATNEYYPNLLVKSQTQFNRSAHFEYSSQGKLTRYQDWFGSVEKRLYDKFGSLVKTVSDNYIILFTYDKLRRISSAAITNSKNNTTFTHQYRYDAAHIDKIAAITTHRDGRNICTQSYQYDISGNLIEKSIVNADGNRLLEEYQYNLANKLISLEAKGNQLSAFENVGSILAQRFDYDVFGNIERLETDYRDNQGQYRTDIATYIYDQNFLLSDIKHSSPQIDDVQLSYDADGNLINNEIGMRLNYNCKNQPENAISANGQLAAEYIYNAQGHLIQQKIPGQDALHYFYTQGNCTHHQQGNAQSKKIVANSNIFGRQLSVSGLTQLEFSISDYKSSQIEIFGSDWHQVNTYSPYGIIGSKMQ